MTRIFILCALSLISFLFSSCSENNTSANIQTEGNDLDLSLYEMRPVPGSDWQHVERNHSTGDIFEEGFIQNGKKVGTWTSYFPDNGYIQSISNYNNGVLMGPFLEFDERGRLNKHFSYENNVLSGLYAAFKNGRITNKVQYSNGKIDGFAREYNNKSVVIKEAYYKNDVLHGEVNSYNEEGKLVLQYIYKNGNKISGGIIE